MTELKRNNLTMFAICQTHIYLYDSLAFLHMHLKNIVICLPVNLKLRLFKVYEFKFEAETFDLSDSFR